MTTCLFEREELKSSTISFCTFPDIYKVFLGSFCKRLCRTIAVPNIKMQQRTKITIITFRFFQMIIVSITVIIKFFCSQPNSVSPQNFCLGLTKNTCFEKTGPKAACMFMVLKRSVDFLQLLHSSSTGYVLCSTFCVTDTQNLHYTLYPILVCINHSSNLGSNYELSFPAPKTYDI
jgi:hypothetical protein